MRAAHRRLTLLATLAAGTDMALAFAARTGMVEQRLGVTLR